MHMYKDHEGRIMHITGAEQITREVMVERIEEFREKLSQAEADLQQYDVIAGPVEPETPEAPATPESPTVDPGSAEETPPADPTPAPEQPAPAEPEQPAAPEAPAAPVAGDTVTPPVAPTPDPVPQDIVVQ